jgi:hypothetical protein
MQIDQYLELCKEIEALEKSTEEGKRASYTSGDPDVLKNFKRDAATAGITPLQNWLTHYLKQVAAIVSFIVNPDVVPSEPLISRVVDARVYPKLLLALAKDEGREVGIKPTFIVEEGVSDQFIEELKNGGVESISVPIEKRKKLPTSLYDYTFGYHK